MYYSFVLCCVTARRVDAKRVDAKRVNARGVDVSRFDAAEVDVVILRRRDDKVADDILPRTCER